jgi:hypothetical protein
MTSPEPAAPGAARICAVVDLEPDVLHGDLLRLEELLLTLRQWAAEAAGPAGDGWTPPGVLAGDAPIATINRLQDVLGPTQSRTELDEQRDRVERPPAGPRWYASNGRFELAALSFVTVAAADVDLLGAIAAELGRPAGDSAVREAVELHEDYLPTAGAIRELERTDRAWHTAILQGGVARHTRLCRTAAEAVRWTERLVATCTAPAPNTAG